MLADMDTAVHASRLMLHEAARSRGPGGSAFPDMTMAARAKLFASEAALKVVSDALQMFGARGYGDAGAAGTHVSRRAHVHDRWWNGANTAHPGRGELVGDQDTANP